MQQPNNTLDHLIRSAPTDQTSFGKKKYKKINNPIESDRFLASTSTH